MSTFRLKDCESSSKARRAGQAPRAGRPGNDAAFEAGQMAPRNAEGAGGQIAKKRALEWVDGKEDPNRYCLSYLALISGPFAPTHLSRK